MPSAPWSTTPERVPTPAGLGLVLPTFPQRDPMPDGHQLANLCRDAEAAGAAGLWACDHLYWHGPSVECLTAVSVAAQSTERCLVGSCVLQLPLRSATVVAKVATSLQQLAGGRLVLGLGVGTHPGEYAAAGVSYARRGALLDAGITALRHAWQSHDTPYAQRPVPTPIPLWVGGSSPAALRRAASCDGWVPLFVSPEDYAARLRAVRQAAEGRGRDPAQVVGAVVAFVSVGADRARATESGVRWMSSLYGLPERAFARHLLAGPPSAVVGELARWVEAGARHVAVFVTDDRPLAPFAELAGEFAGAVAPDRAPAPAGRPVGSVR